MGLSKLLPQLTLVQASCYGNYTGNAQKYVTNERLTNW